LIIRGGAIGDFILTLPAIAAIRNRFPDAHLEVLGYPHIVQLALAGGLVDRVQSIEARALAGFFAKGGMLDQDLADYFSEFDIILSYLYDPDEIFQANVCRCAHGQFLAGPHRPGDGERVHASKVFLKPLERLSIFDADPVPRLSMPSSGPTRNFVAIHPGSGSERKNWPEENWAELSGQLVGGSLVNLLLVGGEAEGGKLDRLASVLPRGRVQQAQSLPLPELARKLQNECAAFVGHDSGISHLAAAIGVPCLVLWGDAPEPVWRPPQEHVVIVRAAEGLAGLSVNRVLQELTSFLTATTTPAGRNCP